MNNQPSTQPAQPIDNSGVPVEALEALRLRLTQVTHTLTKLQTELKAPQLTHYVSLQTQFNIVLTQLASLSQTLSDYSEVLDKTVAYPLPQFPTTEQEGLLTTILRKKPAPEVVEWIEDSLKQSQDILLKDDEGLTQWAVKTMLEMKKEYSFDDVAPAPKEKETGSKPRYTVDQVLKFMYQGDL